MNEQNNQNNNLNNMFSSTNNMINTNNQTTPPGRLPHGNHKGSRPSDANSPSRCARDGRPPALHP